MKKILLVFLIFLVLFASGCKNSYKVSFVDEVTGKPINSVQINGKTVQGEIKLQEGTYKVSKELYLEKTIEVNNESNVFFLRPITYLTIESNAKVNSVKIDGNLYEPVPIIKNGKESYVVSPVPAGTHEIVLESKFFLPIKENRTFENGENIVKINLLEDKVAFSNFLNSLEFPLQGNDSKVKIRLSGIANKNSVDKTFEVTKKSDSFTVKYNALTYTYKNGSFEINGRTVNATENAILQYAKSVIEDFLNLKNFIESTELKEVSDNSFILNKTGDFEGRTINTSVKFTVNNSKITHITLNVSQEQINTNLTIEVEVE